MSVQAVLIDPQSEQRLVLGSVPDPSPADSEAVVAVESISLNRGEIRRAFAAQDASWRPGWDIGGKVVQAAADGSGPKEGTRVVAFKPSGAWAERVAVPTRSLAALPDGVSTAVASTIPVAGLTALLALSKGGLLLERKVLITGATGGVGEYALRLAELSGAHVWAHIRKPDQESWVRAAGAAHVIVGDDLTSCISDGPFDLVLDSVGGKVLGDALGLLAEDGVCVNYGSTGGADVTFNASRFYPTGRASLYGFILFDELGNQPASAGLARLVRLIDAGKLTPRISVEASWTEISSVAKQLVDRAYPGKAVLHIP